MKGNGGDDNIRVGEVVGKRAKPADGAENDAIADELGNDRLAGRSERDRIFGGGGMAELPVFLEMTGYAVGMETMRCFGGEATSNCTAE